MHRYDEPDTRGKRREEKRRKMRKMRVVGRSIRVLHEIVRRRAEKPREKQK
jgi:hypothetical protein